MELVHFALKLMPHEWPRLDLVVGGVGDKMDFGAADVIS